MEFFYLPGWDNQPEFILPEEEVRHAQVLRLKPGESVGFSNGKGLKGIGTIEFDGKRSGRLIVSHTDNFAEPAGKVHIGIAPTKMNERMEWFLEKAAEIGVWEITPILCRHSERKEIKAERLGKTIISAFKQSQRAFLPKLNPLTPFREILKLKAEARYIAHCREGNKNNLFELHHKNKDGLILIGPEGDFTLEEVDLAIKAGFQEVSLGDARLRTETAGIIACHTMVLKNEI